MLHKSFKPAKCKTALNLAKSRIKLMKNKKEIQLRQLKREVAQLLENGQDQTARIRVEHVVREEKTMAAYEMIEIYCELIVARLPIIESQKNCPLDLKEAVTCLIFAAPRCGDIPELQDVRKHFTAKYGKEFVSAAIELRPQCGVSRTLVEKLSVKAPDGPTKVKILKGIAEEHNIKWEPNWFKDEHTVSSPDTPKVSHMETGSKIQMEPLNFEIADDIEDNHGHVMARSETSSQSHALANTNAVSPSSMSRPDARPPGSFSEEMIYSQSSGAFSTGRQNWNMEFKDAASAAHAAAESAERASMAARAAAELSRRSSTMNVSSSGPRISSVHGQSEGDRCYVGSDMPHGHVQGNPIMSSSNQRNSRMLGDQCDPNEQGDMTEGPDVRSPSKHYTPPGLQSDTKQQEFKDSESSSYHLNQDTRRQSMDSVSAPSTSNAEYNVFESSHFQEYEIKPAENPFHEESVEMLNQPSSFQSQSSAFGLGDEYGVFSNLNYRSNQNDSDGGFGAFNEGTVDKDDWHVGTSFSSSFNDSKEDTIFKYHREKNKFSELDEKSSAFDSGSSVFVGADHGASGRDFDEKVNHTIAGAVFDESDSDDECIFDPTDKNNFPTDRSSPKYSSVHKDSHHLEPDLSESFRKSPIYSKLIEPLPVTFDDFDGPTSGNEKELHTEKTDPEFGIDDFRKHDMDARAIAELDRLPFVERNFDSFGSVKHLEEKSTYVNSVDDGKAMESGDPVPEFDYEANSSPESGMGLNLGSLPGGRRNRPNWRPPYTKGALADASSPKYFEAAPSDGFGNGKKTSKFKFQEPSSQMDIKDVSTKMSGFHTDDSEVLIAPKRSNIIGSPYSEIIDENVRKTSGKDPTGFFDSEDSASEEDIPKPLMSKTLLSAGLSRRTKVRAQSSVSTSQPSSIIDYAEKTQPTEVSPKRQTKITSSSSRSTDQSSWDDEATSKLRSETKVPKENKSSSTSVIEKPVTPKAADVSSGSSGTAPPRENTSKRPSHVHPKLPEFETFAASMLSFRKNRQ